MELGNLFLYAGLLDVSASDLESSFTNGESVLIDADLFKSWDICTQVELRQAGRSTSRTAYVPFRSSIEKFEELVERASEGNFLAMSTISHCYDHGFVVPENDLLSKVWAVHASGQVPTIGEPPREILIDECLDLFKSHIKTSQKRSGNKFHLYPESYYNYIESLRPKFSKTDNAVLVYRPTGNASYEISDAFYQNSKGKIVNIYAAVATNAKRLGRDHLYAPLRFGGSPHECQIREETLLLSLCQKGNTSLSRKFKFSVFKKFDASILKSESARKYYAFIASYLEEKKHFPTINKVISSCLDQKRKNEILLHSTQEADARVAIRKGSEDQTLKQLAESQYQYKMGIDEDVYEKFKNGDLTHLEAFGVNDQVYEMELMNISRDLRDRFEEIRIAISSGVEVHESNKHLVNHVNVESLDQFRARNISELVEEKTRAYIEESNRTVFETVDEVKFASSCIRMLSLLDTKVHEMSCQSGLRVYIPCELTYKSPVSKSTSRKNVVTQELSKKEAFKLITRYDVFATNTFLRPRDPQEIERERQRESIGDMLESLTTYADGLRATSVNFTKVLLKEYGKAKHAILWEDHVQELTDKYVNEFNTTERNAEAEMAKLREENIKCKEELASAKERRKIKRSALRKRSVRELAYFKKTIIEDKETALYIATLSEEQKRLSVNTIKREIQRKLESLQDYNAQVLKPYDTAINDLRNRRKEIKERYTHLKNRKTVLNTVNRKAFTLSFFNTFIKPNLMTQEPIENERTYINSKVAKFLVLLLKLIRKHFRNETNANMNKLTNLEEVWKEERTKMRKAKKRLKDANANSVKLAKFEKLYAKWREEYDIPTHGLITELNETNLQLLATQSDISEKLKTVNLMVSLGESLDSDTCKRHVRYARPFRGILIKAKGLEIASSESSVKITKDVESKLSYLGFKH